MWNVSIAFSLSKKKIIMEIIEKLYHAVLLSAISTYLFVTIKTSFQVNKKKTINLRGTCITNQSKRFARWTHAMILKEFKERYLGANLQTSQHVRFATMGFRGSFTEMQWTLTFKFNIFSQRLCGCT